MMISQDMLSKWINPIHFDSSGSRPCRREETLSEIMIAMLDRRQFIS